MPVLEASEVSTVPDLLAREDHRIIADMIGETSTVLDLGCGEGDLLAWLARHKHVEARGVEIAPEKVRRCVELGLSVYQGDINQGLADYPDACFDYVILSQTLQVVQHPLELMREMRRVGRRIVISAKGREGRAWTAKVLVVLERTSDRVVVRDTKPPWVKSPGE